MMHTHFVEELRKTTKSWSSTLNGSPIAKPHKPRIFLCMDQKEQKSENYLRIVYDKRVNFEKKSEMINGILARRIW